ncbi:MAG: tRNA pseudouridine(38-40) synthase TruA [Clostridia bacterium]
MVSKYKLTIMYDGTAYHGWQRQQNGITVQEIMEDTVSRIMSKETAIVGCSRTDAGVHARMYVCSFFADTTIPADKLPFVLNTMLPPDIRAVGCELACEDFNARFDAVKKTYKYQIWNTSFGDPFLRNYAWHYPVKLDFEAMEKACGIIRGEKDFRCFMAAGSVVKNTVRNLSELRAEKDGELITVTASANGFLYNMVRIIVGTLVYIGNGKLKLDELEGLIREGDRRKMGITAPPQGLRLYEVLYD